MNSVILIGRLTRDPELSYTPNTQTAVCRFSVAVDRQRRQGEDQGADFIRITVWGRQAETCDRYLSKGRQVAIRGRIQTGSYTNRDGQKVNTFEVVADNVEFLGSGNGQGGQSTGSQGAYGGGFQGSRNNQPPFGGNDAGFGGETQNTGFSPADEGLGGFDDMPDTFQAAEDDIPF